MSTLSLTVGETYLARNGDLIAVFKEEDGKYLTIQPLPYTADGKIVDSDAESPLDLIQHITDLEQFRFLKIIDMCTAHGYRILPSADQVARHIDDLEEQGQDATNLGKLWEHIHYFELRQNPNFQKMKVGKRYRMYWDDGGTCDYIVTDLGEREYGIIWDNGASMRVLYTCGIHEKSKLIEEVGDNATAA